MATGQSAAVVGVIGVSLQVKTNAQRKKNRWAGAWRAYVRLVRLGSNGRADFGAMARAYRALPLAELEQLRLLSAEGVKRRRRGEESTFGPRRNDVAKARTLARLRARWSQDVAASVRGREDELLKHAVFNSVGDVAPVVVGVRALSRAEAARVRERERDVVATLAEFASGDAQQRALRGFTRLFPEGEELAGAILPAPCAFGRMFEASTANDEAVQAASRAVGWLSSNYKASNLGEHLDKFWSLAHSTFLERWGDMCTAVEDPPLDERCREAGMCICTGAGLQWGAIQNSVYRSIKEAYPRRTDARKQSLVGGACVLRFVREFREDSDSDLVADDNPIEHWLHCGMVYESPFRCTWHIVSRATDPVGELPSGDGRAYIQAPSCNTRPRMGRRLHAVAVPNASSYIVM